MNISIFGLGYVGCVSLGCLAQNGHRVYGVDVVQNKLDLINAGKPTIIEKDIDKIIAEQREKGNISATSDFTEAIHNTDVSIICVGTPSSKEGHLNLTYVFKVAEEIGTALQSKDSFHAVAIRSTVFPGTCAKVAEIIEKFSGKKANVDFALVANPEFLREGTAVKDYYNPAITVIGSESEKAAQMVGSLYEDLEAPIEYVDMPEAEIIKYVNNSFHALKIVFANEIGNICKSMDIDSHEVMRLLCMDDRLNISPYYLKPGFAYGGSCLPKDLKGLKTIAHDHYLQVPVINAISASNEEQINVAYDMVVSKPSKKIGILGLSFKSGTDDLRYSPAVELAERLAGKGYELAIHDENVNLSKITGTNKDYIDHHIPHLSEIITNDLDAVLEQSETLIVTQNKDQYAGLPALFEEKVFIDLVRIKNEQKLRNIDGIGW